MVEERHDIILGSAVAEAGRPRMAAWRRTLADASRVRASGRIARRALARAPDGALAPSPGNVPDEPASVAPGAASIPAPGPEAWGPAIPNLSLSGRRGTCARRVVSHII